jgi:putative autoinducer-2 (AI-2) aldolase
MDALDLAYRSIRAGARGVDMGRNIWQSKNAVGMIRAIRAIVHESASVKEAAKYLKG